jgi:RNA polymerase sigma factor (sigma-70 family)
MHTGKRNDLDRWEIELTQSIASRYMGQMGQDDLSSELCLFLIKLKQKKLSVTKNWKAYLAKSLLRRADRIVRSWSNRQKRTISLDALVDVHLSGDGQSEEICLEDILYEKEEDNMQLESLMSAYNELNPEEKKLWDLLIKEEGNISQVAQEIGKPRKTVDYHIQKLRGLLRSKGFEV